MSTRRFGLAHLRLRIVLSLLVLAALLPPIVLVVFAVWRAWSADQVEANDQFLAQSSNLSEIFSSALSANVVSVRRLASIELNRPGTLVATAGLNSTEVKFTTSGAPHNDEAGWHLSNLFDIEPGVAARVTYSVDLVSSDGPGHSLELTMDPRELTRAIRFDTRLFPGTIIAVVDGNGHIVARSQDEDRFIGARVPTWDALLEVGKPTGTFTAQRLEGDSITFGFSTISGTPGWAVVVGIPTATLASRWSEPTLLIAAGAVLAALTAVLLSWLVASRVSRPISELVAYTGNSDPNAEPPPASVIAEFETLRRELVAAHSTLKHLANHDDLTGLPNRSHMRQRLAEKIGDHVGGSSGALLYIDLDRFKVANDTHGHAAGDVILCIVAERMRALLRPGDLPARLGGDEFAVVIGDAISVDDALATATRIVASMHQPFDVNGTLVHLGASAGIVMLGDEAASIDEIIRRADSALYEAKAAGRGRCAVYGVSASLLRTA